MGVASIESNLDRIASALESIACSLEAPPRNWVDIRGEQTQAMPPINDATPIAASVSYPPATYDEAQGAVMALIGRKSHDAAKAVLTKFKVKYVKDLDSSQYGALVQACKDA